MSISARLSWIIAFGTAFGWLEAAVVVYLRRIYYPAGFALPLQPIDTPILAVELGREAATLIMLAAVAMLAGKTRWQRFAAFIVAFGVWDLVYYLGLKLALDWPVFLADWDVLFLLPWPWLGPVYAPATAALLMVIFGILVFRQEDLGPGRADRLAWLLGASGALVLLFSWLHDIEASLGGALPQPYNIVLFVIGVSLLAACGWRFLKINHHLAKK